MNFDRFSYAGRRAPNVAQAFRPACRRARLCVTAVTQCILCLTSGFSLESAELSALPFIRRPGAGGTDERACEALDPPGLDFFRRWQRRQIFVQLAGLRTRDMAIRELSHDDALLPAYRACGIRSTRMAGIHERGLGAREPGTREPGTSNQRVPDPESRIPDPWDRDEWDVALTDGPTYRLFRERHSDKWFLEGVVD